MRNRPKQEIKEDRIGLDTIWSGEEGIKIWNEVWREAIEYELRAAKDKIKNPSFARHNIKKK